MNNITKHTILGLGLCAVFILAACAQPASQQGSKVSLAGSMWSLSAITGKDLVPGTIITAQFTADGKVSGSAGCNRYSATYSTKGSSIEITSEIASTMMACEQEIMDQEQAYLQALKGIKTYSIAGDQLTLKGADDQSSLVYQAQTQELAGTSWEVVSYNNGKQAVTSVLAGTTLTAEFGKDGVLSGKSGCNSYNGSYTVTGDKVKIGPMASTKMACSDPAGVMEQEAQYLAALETAATYQVEGPVLELRTEDGALAASFRKK
jgi:heat shock protein HslJ